MIESVHCPECQTRYGLRRDRVRYGLRRARCFRCSGVFSIEEEVTHLLAAGLPLESPQPSLASETLGFAAPVLEAAHLAYPPLPEPAGLAEAPESIPAVPAFEPAPEAAFEPLAETLPGPAAALDYPNEMPDSLTLSDLEGAEEEILDKTLVDFRLPEPPVDLAPAEEPMEAITTTGGFSSARDAIDKLLGGVATPTPPTPPRALGRTSNSMDIEATLHALDDTLGGTRSFPPPAAPEAPEAPPVPAEDLDFAFSDLGEPPPLPAQPDPSPATVRLTREEMMAAMALDAPAPPAPSPLGRTLGMPLHQDLPERHPELESTLVMAPPSPAPAPSVAAGAPTAFMPLEQTQDQNLYRAQVGTDTLSNLTMEQMSEMVRAGRLADYHMVARQFSDNWLEAGKIPALRPVFDKVRRERAPQEMPPPPETGAPKKSLFGGLFGRKDG